MCFHSCFKTRPFHLFFYVSSKKILELGAGTGTTSLLCAAFGAHVYATEMV